MTGDLADGPMFDERAIGNDPDLRRLLCEPDKLTFPDADTVVGVATDSHEGNWVWRVELGSKDGDKLKLPQAKRGMLTRWGGYDFGWAAVSPDGQALAVSRRLTSFDLLDRAEAGDAEVDVVQVKPLRLLGVVRPKHPCPQADGLAVDHRDAEATVLAHWCGQWERIQIPPAAVASRK